jgi:hypothetical protein
MFNEVSGDLKVVTNSVGKMAQAMEHEVAIQEKAVSEDPMQKLREQAVNEFRRLEFIGYEVIEVALVFVKMPDQMRMLFALPEPLRREYIVNMLRGNFLYHVCFHSSTSLNFFSFVTTVVILIDESRRKEREERLSR